MIANKNGLKLNVTRNSKYTIIRLNGFVDAYTHRLLENTINGLFRTRAYKIVIDCKELDYVGVRGINTLLTAAGIARRHNGGIILARPTPIVKDVLNLLGVTGILKIVSSTRSISALVANN